MFQSLDGTSITRLNSYCTAKFGAGRRLSGRQQRVHGGWGGGGGGADNGLAVGEGGAKVCCPQGTFLLGADDAVMREVPWAAPLRGRPYSRRWEGEGRAAVAEDD